MDTPGEALLEWDVRTPRLLGRGASRAGDPPRRRGARGRRRGVPEALPRKDGGARKLGPDGPLGIAQHAGDRTALRSRDWLEQGLVVEDGPSSELVANYLQSGHGTGASQSWAEDDAPGDDLVRLRYARVVQDGEEAPAVDVRHPVGIEFGFAVLRDGGPPIFPKIKLVDQRGDVAFNAMDTSARWLETLHRASTSRRHGYRAISSTRA